MYSLDISDAPQRATRFREYLSLVLMLLPLVAVATFLSANPRAWSTDFDVFFSQDREMLRSDPGWILSALALVAAILCAGIGVLGTRDSWKYNRRWQRGALGSVAATLTAVLFSSWGMTQAIESGANANVSLAMFATMCAMLYGVLCAAISPRDIVDVWYSEDGECGEVSSSHSP
ncbi:hypothetical protein QBL02_02490 [Leucobacter sp. UT-8R-CII-1-4]|uniref:hypothetical protein n=1 Tax=Leucobacter sp. UT-8R-CII-1-4 TaxID=3040075 RepID=UPI0024A822B0|nr:hypothetical protein [Leucobacter sp. UT-8R-CII-1-4]MDI6022409.1 hypothetical protein [Leucobacter sp. UT-8R-CII-1-4]